jgi:uncharacterized protein YdhG (YjbR/CyaY superfamily)
VGRGACASSTSRTGRAAQCERGISFTAGWLYVLMRALNSMPEFRQRIRGDLVVEHDVVHPTFTVMGESDVFGASRRAGRYHWSALRVGLGEETVSRPKAASIDDYIAGFPPDTQVVLEQLRALVHDCVPEATETISYAIPTFDLNGRHLVHFAGYDKHVGFYPTPNGMEAFADELKQYKSGKGSLQFPLDAPLPVDLIRRIVEFRVGETEAGTET